VKPVTGMAIPFCIVSAGVLHQRSMPGSRSLRSSPERPPDGRASRAARAAPGPAKSIDSQEGSIRGRRRSAFETIKGPRTLPVARDSGAQKKKNFAPARKRGECLRPPPCERYGGRSWLQNRARGGSGREPVRRHRTRPGKLRMRRSRSRGEEDDIGR